MEKDEIIKIVDDAIENVYRMPLHPSEIEKLIWPLNQVKKEVERRCEAKKQKSI